MDQLKCIHLSTNIEPGKISETVNGNSVSAGFGYTRNVVDELGANDEDYDVLTITYYDNYTFLPDPPDLQKYQFDVSNGLVTFEEALPVARDKITGTKIKVLVMPGDPIFTDWILSVNYYDEKYRLIQNIADDPCLGGINVFSSKFSFTGRLDAHATKHKGFNKSVEFTERYKYDHRGRLLEHRMEGLPGYESVLLSAMRYDQVGNLSKKLVHSLESSGSNDPFIQKTTYRYNIRGWLTSMNDPENTSAGNDIFAMRLIYNEQLAGMTGHVKQYNGNISALQWKTNQNASKYIYRYTYDELNRLTSGEFSHDKDGAWVHDDSFDEKNITYDQNGNIKTLDRYATEGDKLIDQLSYTYLSGGNQISYVKDLKCDVPGVIDYQGDNTDSQKYAYDANGNMVKDLRKIFITIQNLKNA